MRYDINAAGSYWDSFLNFANSVQFFFIKCVITSYHLSTNILFNELDTCLKNIFNFFRNASEGEPVDKAAVVRELNCVIFKLRTMHNNYAYVYSHSRTYANNKRDYDFYFNLASNLSYQQLRLYRLHSNVERLEETICLGVGLNVEVNSKIEQITALCSEFSTAIVKFEEKKFYVYYMIEAELN